MSACRITQPSLEEGAARVLRQIEKQLALQKEISLLIKQTQELPPQARNIAGTKTLQQTVDDLREVHRCKMQAHREWLACFST